MTDNNNNGGSNGTSTTTFVPNQIFTIPVNTGAQGGITITGGNWFTYDPQTQEQQTIEAPPEKKKNSEGCACKKCKEFYKFAEANQPDGTLICWACRHGY